MKKVFIIIFVLTLMLPIITNAETKYLYDVLKNEAESDGLAKEYTGEHHDSFTEAPSHKIYHWYAENDEEGNQVLEKNNVIFGGFCWQIIRTTDTGGIKLIYNGEPENNKCLNNREKHVGYMDSKKEELSSNYYYGTSYYYDNNNKTFKLSGDITTGTVKTKSYTCKLNNSSETCSTIYYVSSTAENNNYVVLYINNNSHYSNVGKVRFNSSPMSIDSFGYMSNKKYYKDQYIGEKLFLFTRQDYHTNKDIYCADDVIWDSSINKWKMVNQKLVYLYDINNNSLKGKYISVSTSNSKNEFSEVFYVLSNSTLSNAKMRINYIELKDGHKEDYYNDTYTYGTNFIDNGNGTYLLENPIEFSRLDSTNYYSGLEKKYVCINASNNICDEVYYVTDTQYPNYISYYNIKKDYKYGNNFSFNNGVYTLTDDIINFFDVSDPKNAEKVRTHHYTCLNKSGTCEKLYFVYFYVPGGSLGYFNYIILTDGVDIETAVEEMLHSDNVNEKDSEIKAALDEWYKNNMLEYKSYTEETIFCNNRSINGYNHLNTNPNVDNSTLSRTLYFNNSDANLNCPLETDKFSIKNNKAKLNYNVGLITEQEFNLSNNNKIRATGENYWLNGPSEFYATFANSHISTDTGSIKSTTTETLAGLRPVVSLKANTTIASGNGSMDKPYTLLYNYKVNVKINNETEDLNVEIEDLSQVPEGEKVKFNVTPIKGYKVTSIKIIDKDNNEIEYETTDNKNYTFTMPASDVTIIPSYERVKNAVTVEDNKNTKEIKIEVNDATAVVYEDKVVFTVVPEEGYVVEEIIIKDKNNHKINYKEIDDNKYEFIMPDTDVVITPKYRAIQKESNNIINPKTSSVAMKILLSIILIVYIGTFIYKKKRRVNI